MKKTKRKRGTIDSAQVQPKRATVSMPVTSDKHKDKRKHTAREHRQESNTQYRNTGRQQVNTGKKATSKHKEKGNT